MKAKTTRNGTVPKPGTGAYLTYPFAETDPIIDQLRELIGDEDLRSIEKRSGVTVSAMMGWLTGRTRRPQHATARAVMRALGHDLQMVRKKDHG